MSPDVLLLILRLAIAIALYAFLAFIMIHLWKDIRITRQTQPISPKAHLVTLEAEHPNLTFDLDELNLIGRAKDNSIVLDSVNVSGYHARLSFRQAQWWLEDLGSRNGSLLNEIQVTEPLVITYGDEMQFGDIRMRLVSGPKPEGHMIQDQPADTPKNNIPS